MRRAITVAVTMTENKYGISMVGGSGERFTFAFSMATPELAAACRRDKTMLLLSGYSGVFCERWGNVGNHCP
jgi:hypothetical protein